MSGSRAGIHVHQEVHTYGSSLTCFEDQASNLKLTIVYLLSDLTDYKLCDGNL